MHISKQSLEDIRNWKKLIVHSATREIEDRMEDLMKAKYGEDVQWAYCNFTEIEMDVEGNIEDQDSSFDPNECDEDEDGVLIPIMLFLPNRSIRKLYIDFDEVCDVRFES